MILSAALIMDCIFSSRAARSSTADVSIRRCLMLSKYAANQANPSSSTYGQRDFKSGQDDWASSRRGRKVSDCALDSAKRLFRMSFSKDYGDSARFYLIPRTH